MWLKELPFGPPPFFRIFTVWHGVNENLLYSLFHYPGGIAATMQRLGLRLNQYGKIKDWLNRKYGQGKLEWADSFCDLETAFEFRDRFFSHLPYTCVLSLGLQEVEVRETAERLLAEPVDDLSGFWRNLLRPVLPQPETRGRLIGYDVITTGIQRCPYFSFYVHFPPGVIHQLFGARVNHYGLLPDETHREAIMTYFRAPDAPVEPESWCWAQVRLHS